MVQEVSARTAAAAQAAVLCGESGVVADLAQGAGTIHVQSALFVVVVAGGLGGGGVVGGGGGVGGGVGGGGGLRARGAALTLRCRGALCLLERLLLRRRRHSGWLF